MRSQRTKNINYSIVKYGETFYGHTEVIQPAVKKIRFCNENKTTRKNKSIQKLEKF